MGVYADRLREVEKLFDEVFPAVREKIPQILSGPCCEGIESLSSAGGRVAVRILITAECREDDTDLVRPALNRFLALLFEANKIELL